jgi:cyclic beta-1,2-glucan synthetase
LLLAALIPASELSVGLVHYLITLMIPPRVLPKLDFKEGIPVDCATFVVMPTMLLRPESAAVLADRLEVHYLSNPDPQLHFAILTDFADAPAETMPEDETYLRAALDRIRALNERYAPDGPARFFLFHRRRRWNPAQGCWMGWERKRGKLVEFNRLLRGGTDTSFAWVSAQLSELPYIRFVITLDFDTQLPREIAQRLVGTLAHPLNRPHYEPEHRQVVEGYGVLQPRVSLSLVATTRSLFAQLMAQSAGLDPYTTAVSDVYQDLFGIGTFTGKGIYDVDAFLAAAGNTFPENHILSHDLIEGNYARCGLVTDIELLDDFPAGYPVYARREHRWIRGDWQLLPWLFRKVPAVGRTPPDRSHHSPSRDRPGAALSPPSAPEPLPEGRGSDSGSPAPAWVANPLPAVERWKILDNLRRSLVPPSLVLLFVLGWLLSAGASAFWTVLGLTILVLPLLLTIVNTLVHPGSGSVWMGFRSLLESVKATGGQVMLALIFLPEQSRLTVDAVCRTLVRLAISRRLLLEWETAASTERRLGTRFSEILSTMWLSSVFAGGVGLLLALIRPESLWTAGPILVAWFVSPAVAYWVSRPPQVREAPLTAEERSELRQIARGTWSFFETFVGDEDHRLPPDNFQEHPKGQVAHRTSPTNVGFYLLSALSAHDLGYLSLNALLDRLELTFETLDRLERFHGHFYNWYDTRTLLPLQPGYISTVDSGNLLGCLIALKQGLLEAVEENMVGPPVPLGLGDTLRFVAKAFQAVEPPQTPEPLAVFQTLELDIKELDHRLRETPLDLCGWEEWLDRLDQRAAELGRHIQALAGTLHGLPEELERWARAFAGQVRDRHEALIALAPWLPLLRAPNILAGGKGLSAALAERWLALRNQLIAVCSLADLHTLLPSLRSALAELQEMATSVAASSVLSFLSALEEAVARSRVAELQTRCRQLADRATAYAGEMNFRILYNEQRQLFSVGFNLGLNRLDNAHYDLLASEACLTSFLAIARGDVPKRHWFHLARPLTRVGGGVALLSWGGTMFEYLMPRLLLRAYPGTLLEECWRSAVDRQIQYGRQHHVPWGISESGFNALDTALDYQYQSFGVPGLGLKRGLGQNLVIAPYATALALLARPHAAVENLRRLRAEDAEGDFGFYEALDYTRDRMTENRRPAVVRSYMAHHQGMSLTALADCLLGERFVRRFHTEPMVRATELLLQERVPWSAPLQEGYRDEAAQRPPVREHALPMSRRVTTPQTPHPRTHLLSNGRYHVMVTNAGSGQSTWHDLDVTRWREDRTCDGQGQFCYVRDLRSDLLWSTGFQPTGRTADRYEVLYSTDKADFHRFDGGLETHLEIAVSPENAAEVRRVTLTNHNPRSRELELTSYLELVLGPHGGDLAHPAFGKLFLETEFVSTSSALLCRRRPRSPEQKPIWAVHALAVDGHATSEPQYETDRARFLGRGRTASNPLALERGAVLSGTTGPVLDPIFSLRIRIRVGAGASATVAFTTAVAETREEALALADQYHDLHGVTRAFELAWAHSQVELRHLRLSAEEAHMYQRLAAHILYAGPTLRSADAVLANQQGQPGLWRHGISGDRPIVLVRLADARELPLVRQLLAAHAYWRLKGLAVDLIILNDYGPTYLEELQQEVQNLVRASESHALVDRPGGVFVRKASLLSEEDKILLQAAARVVLVGNRGSLSGQVDRSERPLAVPARLTTPERRREGDSTRPTGKIRRSPAGRLFANGLGGFSADGREYVVEVSRQAPESGSSSPRTNDAGQQRPLQLPPAPWINVIANPNFGFLISESGSGYSWQGNSQSNRLTPWNNDPVSDPPGEVIYLRDEATGEFWTPTPLPIPSAETAVVRHGQGYTLFEQQSHGLAQELLLFVPSKDPIKLLRLKVRNLGSRRRRLSATFYAEWVLGTVRDQAALNVVPFLEPESGAMLARNAFNGDFAPCVGFADVSLRPRTYTSDRTEFLGRNGSVAAPAALERVGLSGRVEPALDPCAALMAPFDLQPGEEKEIVFFLGQARNRDEVQRLLRRYRQPGQVQKAFQEVRETWNRLLETIEVHTPNPAMDLLLNRWLVYQVLSCRVWARSAFYQSGGAYGFRDQLQDVMALVYSAPEEARAQILRAASRQFLEGDVQHWWHPPAGRGIRTKFADDFLWLPLVASHYVETTGDAAILAEKLPFLKAPLLRPEQDEEYGLPETTQETATLYEHCLRALEHGFRFGAHSLPLMGTGDWNDGMNRVGAGGKGESVWIGWFLLAILRRFLGLVESRGEAERATRYRALAETVRQAIEEKAWDGRWYRRAYFDDGTPLGSAQNEECRIDSIAQTWAVISGAADPERARQAMAAVEEFLVRPADRLILLFTPPFDQGKLQPGYIKGYVPGIRENGGQYTHAATWVVQATALLGQGSRAMELFDLLNPIHLSATATAVARYKVEPYVLAGDIYSLPPHTGRGGWTWYSGSAGWLYRVGLETILGFHREGDRLRLQPCIPKNWPVYEITYRHRSATYHIRVENPQGVEDGVKSVTLDGNLQPSSAIDLADDGKPHEVRVMMGA